MTVLSRAAASIFELFGILLMTIFICGVFSVQLFGRICIRPDHNELPKDLRCQLIQPDRLLDPHVQFSNLLTASVSLFIVAMGDGWSEVMDKCSVTVYDFPRSEGHMDRAIANVSFYLANNATEAGMAALRAARNEFPGCVAAGELTKLADLGFIDCQDSFGTACESTCGTVGGRFFFPFFFVATNIIVLNLVVATLLDSVGKSEEPLEGMLTTTLSLRSFHALFSAWRRNCLVRHQLGQQPPEELSYELQQHKLHEQELARQRNLNTRSGARKGNEPIVQVKPVISVSETRKKKREILARARAAQKGKVDVYADLVLKMTTMNPLEFEAIVATTTRDIELRKSLARARRAERAAVERWKSAIEASVSERSKVEASFGPPDNSRLEQARRTVARRERFAERKARDRDQLWLTCNAERGGLEHGALDGMLGMKWVAREEERTDRASQEAQEKSNQADLQPSDLRDVDGRRGMLAAAMQRRKEQVEGEEECWLLERLVTHLKGRRVDHMQFLQRIHGGKWDDAVLQKTKPPVESGTRSLKDSTRSVTHGASGQGSADIRALAATEPPHSTSLGATGPTSLLSSEDQTTAQPETEPDVVTATRDEISSEAWPRQRSSVLASTRNALNRKGLGQHHKIEALLRQMGVTPRRELALQVQLSLGDENGNGGLMTTDERTSWKPHDGVVVGMLASRDVMDRASFSGLNEFETGEMVLVCKGRLATFGKVVDELPGGLVKVEVGSDTVVEAQPWDDDETPELKINRNITVDKVLPNWQLGKLGNPGKQPSKRGMFSPLRSPMVNTSRAGADGVNQQERIETAPTSAPASGSPIGKQDHEAVGEHLELPDLDDGRDAGQSNAVEPPAEAAAVQPVKVERRWKEARRRARKGGSSRGETRGDRRPRARLREVETSQANGTDVNDKVALNHVHGARSPGKEAGDSSQDLKATDAVPGLRRQAAALQEAGDCKGAERLLQRALHMDSKNEETLRAYGRLLMMTRDEDGAAVLFRTARAVADGMPLG